MSMPPPISSSVTGTDSPSFILEPVVTTTPSSGPDNTQTTRTSRAASAALSIDPPKDPPKVDSDSFQITPLNDQVQDQTLGLKPLPNPIQTLKERIQEERDKNKAELDKSQRFLPEWSKLDGKSQVLLAIKVGLTVLTLVACLVVMVAASLASFGAVPAIFGTAVVIGATVGGSALGAKVLSATSFVNRAETFLGINMPVNAHQRKEELLNTIEKQLKIPNSPYNNFITKLKREYKFKNPTANDGQKWQAMELDTELFKLFKEQQTIASKLGKIDLNPDEHAEIDEGKAFDEEGGTGEAATYGADMDIENYLERTYGTEVTLKGIDRRSNEGLASSMNGEIHETNSSYLKWVRDQLPANAKPDSMQLKVFARDLDLYQMYDRGNKIEEALNDKGTFSVNTPLQMLAYLDSEKMCVEAREKNPALTELDLAKMAIPQTPEGLKQFAAKIRDELETIKDNSKAYAHKRLHFKSLEATVKEDEEGLGLSDDADAKEKADAAAHADLDASSAAVLAAEKKRNAEQQAAKEADRKKQAAQPANAPPSSNAAPVTPSTSTDPSSSTFTLDPS